MKEREVRSGRAHHIDSTIKSTAEGCLVALKTTLGRRRGDQFQTVPSLELIKIKKQLKKDQEEDVGDRSNS